MSKLRYAIATFLIAPALAVGLPAAAPTIFQAAAASALTAADTDSDGTLDLNEVKAAAGKKFDALDTDKDGTLDRKETKHHISKHNFKAADPDHDKTLDKTEYLTLAEKLFKKADKDNDGTIDAKELRSKAGRKLDRLIN